MSELSKKDKQGLAIVGVVVLGFFALIAAFFVTSSKEKPDERGCFPTITAKTAILIDRSDDTPLQTVDEIQSRIRKLVSDEVEEGELVSIFYITKDATKALRPVFSACKPQSSGNIIYEDESRIVKNFEESFEAPLEEALAEQPAGSETSPIGEVLTDFLASDILDGERNRLAVFSDLMQNSESLSLYRCGDASQAIEAYTQARTGAVIRPKLNNVDVTLHIIPRQELDAATVKCRDAFWIWFFGDNGGALASVTPRYLPGGASIQ